MFGWLTGALIAAIVGLGAVKGKVALILLINAVAGPGWAIVASIAIGNPSFESFWTTFVVAAGAMAGQDMNKAIYDKITSLFE